MTSRFWCTRYPRMLVDSRFGTNAPQNSTNKNFGSFARNLPKNSEMTAMTWGTRYLGVVADVKFGIGDLENPRGKSFVSFESEFQAKPRRIRSLVILSSKWVLIQIWHRIPPTGTWTSSPIVFLIRRVFGAPLIPNLTSTTTPGTFRR